MDTLELLFAEYSKPIPDILDEYAEFEKTNSTNLNSYLRGLIISNTHLEDEENIMRKILSEDLGLEVHEIENSTFSRTVPDDACP